MKNRAVVSMPVTTRKAGERRRTAMIWDVRIRIGIKMGPNALALEWLEVGSTSYNVIQAPCSREESVPECSLASESRRYKTMFRQLGQSEYNVCGCG